MDLHLLLRTEFWLCVALLIIFFLLLILWDFIKRQKEEKRRLHELERLYGELRPTDDLMKNLNRILTLLSRYIEGDFYALYRLNPRSGQLILETALYREEEPGAIMPSYSGLIPGTKEKYTPPLILSKGDRGKGIALAKHGEVPVLQFSLPDQTALIAIGPRRRASKREYKAISSFSKHLFPLLSYLFEIEKRTKQAALQALSASSLQEVAPLLYDPSFLYHKVFATYMKSYGFLQGLIAVREKDQGGGLPHILCSLCLSQEGIPEKNLCEWFERLEDLMQGTESRLLSAEEAGIAGVPFGAVGSPAYLKRVERERETALLILLGEKEFLHTFESDKLDTLASLLVNDLFDLRRAQEKTALLSTFVRAVENANPYLVGYSEQMMRYTVALAKEIGFPRRELPSLATAAYLSNIGMYVLSEELMLKTGEYQFFEYEQMKMHAEIGALIVEIFLGNQTAAEYIRYHHERMDGNGYPAGLRGENIPLGARIIAVVQTFLAKVNGRAYRAPLPFDTALQHVEMVGGSQLDGAIVSALVSWLEQKRAFSEEKNHPLGRCREVLNIPTAICKLCPVYMEQTLYCWEAPENKCLFHGKRCDTCLVKTEFLSRKRGKKERFPSLIYSRPMKENRLQRERLKGIDRFTVFYGRGEVERLKEFPLVIVEPQGQSRESVTLLHQAGTLVIAYVSVMEIARGSFDEAGEIRDEDYLYLDGKRLVNREYGNELIDLRSSRWRRILIRSLSVLKEEGYDGFFLDTIANAEYDEMIPIGRREQLKAAVDLVREIRLQFPDMILIQNNGLQELVDQTAKYIDGVCWENPPYREAREHRWFRSMIHKLHRMSHRDQMKVFVLVNSEEKGSSPELNAFRRLCKEHGFLFALEKEGYGASKIGPVPMS